MSTLNYVGGCQCGSVRFETVGELTNLCVCHCSDCRRSAGAPMVAWATVARTGFRVTHGRLAEYRSSAKAARGFCARCGTSLTYGHDERPDEIDVTLASFDAPEVPAPEAHVWVRSKLPWVVISDGRPQFPCGTSEAG